LAADGEDERRIESVNVLLVEDEIALANVLARNLRARGHAVSTAGTAEGALLSMAESWPEALVLDINLPDDTGWEVLRRLSPTDRDRLNVVVISAAPVSQRRVQEFRPAHVLMKPFPLDALDTAITGEFQEEEKTDG
jgi:DNA-binding response OmpR family regulator